MKTNYRYRDNSGSTTHSLERMKHLTKIGQVTLVRGYEYRGRYGAMHVGVMVKGTKGSCRFNGFCFGYGGTGPNGLVELLVYLGLPKDDARAIAFNIPTQEKPGVRWEVEFANFYRVKLPPIATGLWKVAA